MRKLTFRAPLHLMDALSLALFEAGAQGLQDEGVGLSTYVEDAALETSLVDAVNRLRSQHTDANGQDPIEAESEEVTFDWQGAWLKALKPVRLAGHWVFRPTHCRPAPSTERTLWFEPQASFGDGSHPTTQLAASSIAKWAKSHKTLLSSLRFLDVGAGNGVLSLIAARAGIASVLAIDIDDVAVSSMSRNLELNDLTERVAVKKGSADCTQDTFDFVVANINTPVLHTIAPHLFERMNPKATLTLTGLLDEDSDGIIRHFSALGLTLVDQQVAAPWMLLEFVRA